MAKAKAVVEKVRRNFPTNTLEQALPVAQKIADERGGKPFKRLLLAEALGSTPSSSTYRVLLSSAYKYGLTEGTEKASDIGLTELGAAATQTQDPGKRMSALRQAALRPSLFKSFFKDYKDKKLPSAEMLGKILQSEYEVPAQRIQDCARTINENGRFTEIIRDIGGSPHVLFDAPAKEFATTTVTEDDDEASDVSDIHSNKAQSIAAQAKLPATPDSSQREGQISPSETQTRASSESTRAKPIFIGHGKNKVPLQKLQALLSTFQIPHKVTIDEANLGRPIPQKVKETMDQCGSAILIFTKDEKLFDASGGEVWRPSENVVHELGASSYAYGDRIVIFKEKGLNFPTNFQSIGYIEFDVDTIESKTADLLKELIGFGLVRVSPA